MGTYHKHPVWKSRSPCCGEQMKPLTMAHTALKCLCCGKVWFNNGGTLKEVTEQGSYGAKHRAEWAIPEG